MFNRSIVSAGPRAAGSSRSPSSSSWVWRRRHSSSPRAAAAAFSCLSPSFSAPSLPAAPPPLYVYSFICWWLIPHYRDRSTDKRNVLGNTQCALPIPRAAEPAASLGHRRREEKGRRVRVGRRTRRHQEQRRIFPATSPLRPFSSPSTTSAQSLSSSLCSRCRRRLHRESRYHPRPSVQPGLASPLPPPPLSLEHPI